MTRLKLSELVACLCFFIFASHLVPVVSAANTVTFINHCTYPLYFWVVPPRTPEDASRGTNLPPQDLDYFYVGSQSRALHLMQVYHVGGVSLKVRDLPYYETAPAGIMQAEYRYEPGTKIWYDLSYINCKHHVDPTDPEYCPFAAGGMIMYATGEQCGSAHCQFPGPCERTYLEHGSWKGEPTLACAADEDIFVETCIQSPGKRSNPHGWELWNPPEIGWVQPPFNALWATDPTEFEPVSSEPPLPPSAPQEPWTPPAPQEPSWAPPASSLEEPLWTPPASSLEEPLWTLPAPQEPSWTPPASSPEEPLWTPSSPPLPQGPWRPNPPVTWTPPPAAPEETSWWQENHSVLSASRASASTASASAATAVIWTPPPQPIEDPQHPSTTLTDTVSPTPLPYPGWESAQKHPGNAHSPPHHTSPDCPYTDVPTAPSNSNLTAAWTQPIASSSTAATNTVNTFRKPSLYASYHYQLIPVPVDFPCRYPNVGSCELWCWTTHWNCLRNEEGEWNIGCPCYGLLKVVQDLGFTIPKTKCGKRGLDGQPVDDGGENAG